MNPWPEFVAFFLTLLLIFVFCWRFFKGKKVKPWLNGFAMLSAIIAALGTVGTVLLTYWSLQYYVTDYDAKTEELASSLREKLYAALMKYDPKDSSHCGYEKYEAFYAEINNDIERLQFRVNVIPNNQQSIAYVRVLVSSLERFKELHKASKNNTDKKNPGCMAEETIFRVTQTFDVLIGSIVEHEIDKKPKSLGLFLKYIQQRPQPLLAPMRNFFQHIRDFDKDNATAAKQ